MIERETSDLRFAKIYQLLGWKRYKEAKDECMALIQDEPEDANAYAVLAQICVRMNNYSDAIHWSQESLRRDPENKIAWFVRTITYYETKNWRAMDEALENAQRVDPYEPYYFFLRSSVCNRKNKFVESKENLLKGLQLEPHNALFLAALSHVEALLGNKTVSKQYAKEALQLEVESDTVYLYLGWAAEQRNDYDEQLLMLKNAIQLDPTDEQIRGEYLEALQKSYWFYRVLLAPTGILKRLKPWQILLGWFAAFLIAKPLLVVFIVLYIFTHWVTKLLVHVKIFGWTFKK